MKLKKTVVVGISFVTMVTILAFFSGTFGDYGGDDGREVIGFIAEDGTYLDLDKNPISEEYTEDEISEGGVEDKQME